MLVKDVMSSHALEIAPETSLESALSSMVEAKESCLIVTSAHQPIGIVTGRDISKAFVNYLSGKGDRVQKIQDIMTLHPVVLTPDISIEDALTLSTSRKLRHLPVVNDQNILIDLVTQTSLISQYSKLIRKQTELENNIEQLKLLCLEDPLLGIGNRRAMEVELTHLRSEALRYGKSLSIALFDIDFFKMYNDRYGHEAGDNALRQVAQTIKKTIRGGDRVFRYGGEEILVLMPETIEEVAENCAQRIRQAVEQLAIDHKDSPTKRLTISGGVATNHNSDTQLIKRADQALYQAKHSGRNCIRCFVPED